MKKEENDMRRIMAVFMAAMTLMTTVPVMADYNPISPVYEFYSPYMRDYLLTSSSSEKEQLERNYYIGTETYQYDGIVSYVETASTPFNTPVYRFWNPVTCDHFYTISESEKNQVQKDLRNGTDNYEYEGIAWYSPTYSGNPVYRFFDVVNFNHYYTSNESERSSMQQDYLNGTGRWRYEGIAWYWYA